MSVESAPFVALIAVFLVIGGVSAFALLHARAGFQRLALLGVFSTSLWLLAAATVSLTVPGRTVYHDTLRVPGFVWVGLIVLWAAGSALFPARHQASVSSRSQLPNTSLSSTARNR